MLVKCQYCDIKVEKSESIRHNEKNYHSECYLLQIDKENLTEYILQLFQIKKLGPIINQQRFRYMKNLGYTDYGMLKTLQYAYEVKKIKKEKAEERIGIIPYLYDEAKKYWEKIEQEQIQIANSLAESIKRNATEIRYEKFERKKREEKQEIDVTTLFDDEEDESYRQENYNDNDNDKDGGENNDWPLF